MRERVTLGYKCALFLLICLTISSCGGGSLSVTDPSNPVINWNPPASIQAGTALDETELNATANVQGKFDYNPAPGTVLTPGDYTLTATFSPTDTTKYKPATASAKISVYAKQPVVTWPTPAPLAAGTPLSSAQLDATADVPGSFAYSPAQGTVLTPGTHTLSVTFTPTDTKTYGAVTAQSQVTVGKVTPTVQWNSPAAIAYGSALCPTQLNATANIPGSFTYSPAAGTVLSAGVHTLTAAFVPADADSYNAITASVNITINQGSPVITWNAPASIAAGTALSAAQLNATANVPGTFAYIPEAGSVLSSGTHTLTATFTPADTSYKSATASVSIAVGQGTPVISWSTPASITAGTALSAAQLNASANVPGAFAYSPAAGTVLSAGTQTLTATFTPTDTSTYKMVTASVSITVTASQGTPVITWGAPASITAGTALSAAQLNATANVPGTFTYSPAAGTVLTAGTHALTATFTPTNTSTYKTVTASVSITVTASQGTPVITWSAPASITAGTALTAAQLNATANVPGTFAYSPAAGTVLTAGTQALTATFTPTDTTAYKTVTTSVSITVTASQGTPVITWSTPASVAAGTALSAAQLNATANVPGTFTYNPAAGTVLTAGTQTLTASFTPTDTSAYKTVTANVSITVTKANPVITWNPLANIVTGTALGANQLNATASVPGSFIYNPAAGTVLSAGSYALAVTFTPSDTANYAVVTASNSLTVTTSTQDPTGPVVNVTPSMSTSQIQSALNGAPSGATISFAAGNYNITSRITVPCANLQLTGPVADTPTATLSANYINDTILGYNGGCSSLGAIRYLGFANTGAVYFGVGNNGNFTFEHNQIGNLPSNESNLASESGLFFDGSLGTTLSNILVQYNTFGDSNSCASVFATPTDEGGYCAGVTASQGEIDSFTAQYNTFEHVEEGIHFNQLASWSPGAQDSVCVGCKIDTNYIAHYHRIGIEMQVDTPTDPIMLEHNAIVDPVSSSWGTFAVSLACCQWGKSMATVGNSPGLVFNDNVLVASQPCGKVCPPYGVEFWGTGSQGTNSLIQGTFSNGYTWGFGEGAWSLTNNYICGPNYTTQGGYISNEESQSNTPSESGNVLAAQCQATTSVAPTIAPSGGSFTTSQLVTLSNAGANTGIWYTTDGSTPVPGSGTAKYYTGPFTISSSTVVKAVGMWGAANQPTSYPAGYGYVPSAVVTATFSEN